MSAAAVEPRPGAGPHPFATTRAYCT